MRDLRLPFMWKEHENVTKQQINPTQDTLGKFSVHIKKGNIQPFQEWKKSEEGMKKRNKCGTQQIVIIPQESKQCYIQEGIY